MTTAALKAQRPAAQEYWHKVMTIKDRTAVIMAVPHKMNGKRRESENAYYHRCLDYVIETQGEKVAVWWKEQVAILNAIISQN